MMREELIAAVKDERAKYKQFVTTQYSEEEIYNMAYSIYVTEALSFFLINRCAFDFGDGEIEALFQKSKGSPLKALLDYMGDDFPDFNDEEEIWEKIMKYIGD